MSRQPGKRTRRRVVQTAGGAVGGLLLTPIIAAAAPSGAGDKDKNRPKHGPKRGGPSLVAAVEGVKNAPPLDEIAEHHRLSGLLPPNPGLNDNNGSGGNNGSNNDNNGSGGNNGSKARVGIATR